MCTCTLLYPVQELTALLGEQTRLLLFNLELN